MKEKKKTVDELKKAISNVDKVVLATDPDREGEAISWHLKDELNIKDKDYEYVNNLMSVQVKFCCQMSEENNLLLLEVL